MARSLCPLVAQCDPNPHPETSRWTISKTTDHAWTESARLAIVVVDQQLPTPGRALASPGAHRHSSRHVPGSASADLRSSFRGCRSRGWRAPHELSQVFLRDDG